MKKKTLKEAYKVIKFINADISDLFNALGSRDKKAAKLYASDLSDWADELMETLEED